MQQDSAQCHDSVSHAFENEALLKKHDYMDCRLVCNLHAVSENCHIADSVLGIGKPEVGKLLAFEAFSHSSDVLNIWW